MRNNSLSAGSLRVRLTSADIPSLLSAIHQKEIPVFDVTRREELSVDVTINKVYFESLRALITRRGEKYRILHKAGFVWMAKSAIKRPILLIFAFIIFMLSVFLPSRVLFIKVDGNVSIPSRYILDEAQNCGITFGASRRLVRSEHVKNALMERIPDLSWVGVNTSGFVATISVKEKNKTDNTEKTWGISSIVAARDGIIKDITVLKGNGVCKSGQAVKAGQVLISGYEDLGLVLRATKAEGEVSAQTLREIALVAPICTQIRGQETHRERKYSIIIGKKHIKLYKDSGISDSTCVKIYDKKVLTLPGDMQLPIAIITEEWIYYDHSTISVSENGFDWMQSYAQDYLSTQMVAGSILNEEIEIQMLEDACLLKGRYACIEMIGQVRNEEIIQNHGKDS